MTNPRLPGERFSLEEAVQLVDRWLEQPNVRLLAQGDDHWLLLRRMIVEGQAPGALVSDGIWWRAPHYRSRLRPFSRPPLGKSTRLNYPPDAKNAVLGIRYGFESRQVHSLDETRVGLKCQTGRANQMGCWFS